MCTSFSLSFSHDLYSVPGNERFTGFHGACRKWLAICVLLIIWHGYWFDILSPLFSVEECRNIIVQFGVREVTAVQVARVLGMMARTHSGLTDGISLQVRVYRFPV